MKIAVCIDDNNGMMFHSKRISRDREIIKDLITLSGSRGLLIHSYSEALFDKGDNVIVDDDFLDKAGDDDICFVENRDIIPYADRISEIILYHWNRRYPSDMKFSLDMSGYKLTSRKDFAGYSHEKITREEYCIAEN